MEEGGRTDSDAGTAVNSEGTTGPQIDDYSLRANKDGRGRSGGQVGELDYNDTEIKELDHDDTQIRELEMDGVDKQVAEIRAQRSDRMPRELEGDKAPVFELSASRSFKGRNSPPMETEGHRESTKKDGM